MQIAKGVLNEDDYLLQEILFNPYTSGQVSQIREELAELIDIIDHKDAKRMKLFLTKNNRITRLRILLFLLPMSQQLLSRL